ncbi:MAG: hypothetical protein ACM3S2_22355 [Ignavibacteriales bacterium]
MHYVFRQTIIADSGCCRPSVELLQLCGRECRQESTQRSQLFIDPYVVDPSDENVMIYAAGGDIWRTSRLGSLVPGMTGATSGWTQG